MTATADIAAAFAEKSITCPVLLGATATRGMFDMAGSLQKLGGIDVQAMSTTLYVQAGTLGALERGSEILIGALGADSAAGGTKFRITDFEPIEDGLLTAIAIGGGPQ